MNFSLILTDFSSFILVKPEVSGVGLSSITEMSDLQSTMLKCNFTGRPKVNATWKHPREIKGIASSTHKDTAGLTSTVGYFNITSVPKACSTYNISCVGENQFGKQENSTVLRVTGTVTFYIKHSFLSKCFFC